MRRNERTMHIFMYAIHRTETAERETPISTLRLSRATKRLAYLVRCLICAFFGVASELPLIERNICGVQIGWLAIQRHRNVIVSKLDSVIVIVIAGCDCVWAA